MSRGRSRRQEQADQTRILILDAALHLFATQGYSATSVAQIAEEAGVAVPTVYTSVGAKPVLIRKLLDRIDELAGIPELGAQQREAKSPEQVIAFVARLTRQLSERCGDIMTALRSAAGAAPELAELLAEGDSRHLEGARQAAGRLAAMKGLRPGLTTDRATAVIDTCTQPSAYARWTGVHGLSFDEAEAQITQILTNELLAQSEW